jgi:hypothetical protein
VEVLQREIGADFAQKEYRLEEHVTPGGVRQMYLYGRFQASFFRPGEEIFR